MDGKGRGGQRKRDHGREESGVEQNLGEWEEQRQAHKGGSIWPDDPGDLGPALPKPHRSSGLGGKNMR